jgi:hypothetical protein
MAANHTSRGLESKSEEISECPKKKQHTMMTAAKIIKKDFDSPPSMLSMCVPLPSKKLFKTMVADWWLQSHPDSKMLEKGGEWLAGFYDCLNEDELHPADHVHIKELTAWHEEKQNEVDSD